MNLYHNLQFENCMILEFDNHDIGIKFYYNIQIEPGGDFITSVTHQTLRLAQTAIGFRTRNNLTIIKDRYDDQSCIVRCLLSEHHIFEIGSVIPSPYSFIRRMNETHHMERLQYYTAMKQQLFNEAAPGLIDINDKPT